MAKRIGALWAHKKNDGEVFLSGTIDIGPMYDDLQVVVWKNKNKEKDSHPDYVINLSTPKKEAEEVDTGPADTAPQEDVVDVDDVPL